MRQLFYRWHPEYATSAMTESRMGTRLKMFHVLMPLPDQLLQARHIKHFAGAIPIKQHIHFADHSINLIAQ